MKNPFKKCIPWRNRKKRRERDLIGEIGLERSEIDLIEDSRLKRFKGASTRDSGVGSESHSYWKGGSQITSESFSEKNTNPFENGNVHIVQLEQCSDQNENSRLLKSHRLYPSRETSELVKHRALPKFDPMLDSGELYDKEKYADTREERLNQVEKTSMLLNHSPLSKLDDQLNSDDLYNKEKYVDTDKERLDDVENNPPKDCKCNLHTDYIRQQTYKNLLEFVPAFKQEFQIALTVDICYRPPECGIPVFLVETKAFKGKLEWRGIEVFCFQHNVPASSEGKDVFAREGLLQNKKAIEVSKIIQETQEDYAKMHSNITIISASRFKSKSFGKNWTLEDTNCIVIYCSRKGFVPFLEEFFPTNIKGIPVDVREGMVEVTAGTSPYYGNIQSGITISAYGCLKSGTLGPIFDQPTYNYPCALTNAHVVLSDTRMWSLLHNKRTISDNDQVYIMNPPGARSSIAVTDDRIFGRVLNSAITKGGGFDAGTDVSVLQITSRFPDSGFFPSSTEESLREIGYSSNYPPLYQGEMQKNVDLWRFHDVIKFGAATGWTRGVPYLTSVFTRRCNFVPQGPFVYSLCNQIEIKSLQGSDFGKTGDSGSTIFYRREEDNQLVAVGLLNGVTSYGSSIVSPIADCLKAVGLENLTHFKRFPDRTSRQNIMQNTNANVSAVGSLATRRMSNLYIHTTSEVKESHINKHESSTMKNSECCLGLFLPNGQQTEVCQSNFAGEDSGYGAPSVHSSFKTFNRESEKSSSNSQDQKHNIIPKRCLIDSMLHKPIGKCYPNQNNTESSCITDEAIHDTIGAEGGVSLPHSTLNSISLELSPSTESISFAINDENEKCQIPDGNNINTLTNTGNQKSRCLILQNDGEICFSAQPLSTESLVDENSRDSYSCHSDSSYVTAKDSTELQQHADSDNNHDTDEDYHRTKLKIKYPILSDSTNQHYQNENYQFTNLRSTSSISSDSINHCRQQELV